MLNACRAEVVPFINTWQPQALLFPEAGLQTFAGVPSLSPAVLQHLPSKTEFGV